MGVLILFFFFCFCLLKSLNILAICKSIAYITYHLSVEIEVSSDDFALSDLDACSNIYMIKLEIWVVTNIVRAAIAIDIGSLCQRSDH